MAEERFLTRRGFLGISALALQGALLLPNTAIASPMYSVTREIEGSDTARAMWADAVSKANKEGSPIISSDDECRSVIWDSLIEPCANARTVSVSKRAQIGLINDVIIISADYAVSNADRISQFNWAKIYCSASSVKSSSYHRTILDNGRTNAISFHAEIVGAGGWPTYVGDFYAEFYYTFTGRFQ